MEADHKYLYHLGKKISPTISDMGNTTVLSIPYLAQPPQLAELAKQAQDILQEGRWIIWEIEWPWKDKPIFIQDSTYFFSLGLWLKELSQELFLTTEENSLGIVLFRGDCNFASYFLWTEQQENHYLEMLHHSPSLSFSLSRFFFAADIFAEYLQRLCSFLPDFLPAFCLLDTRSLPNLAQIAYFATKERFGHLLLGTQENRLHIGHLVWQELEHSWTGKSTFASDTNITLGVCLPPLDQVSDVILDRVNTLLEDLCHLATPFRLVTETYLHESWDGFDSLIVFTDLLSIQGMRKVRGFLAAGGDVIDSQDIKEKLHL